MEEKKKLFRGKTIDGKESAVAAVWPSTQTTVNPWSVPTVDLLEATQDGETNEQVFYKAVEDCRFFYKCDPLASTTLNKMVELGINELKFSKNGLSENEFRVFEAIEDDLKEFAEVMALEFLLSGLVVPEIRYAAVPKDTLKKYGIKKYDSLILPVSMWLRDPKTIKINSVLSDKPSYYVKVPAEMLEFIRRKGMYPDGNSDEKLYAFLLAEYPDFVSKVQNGKNEILLENDLILRRRYLSDNCYPIPYLSATIESLKHKRNLRRMDYSIASRVISAIQLFNLGNDEYPLTEEDGEDQIAYLKNQMMWRYSGNQDMERIFQLFANHTVKITWVFPDTQALLNDAKYAEVNKDIITSLGFPRILITGESERTGASDPEYAMMSPERTMEYFRDKVLKVIEAIVFEVAQKNKFKTEPEVEFAPINLIAYNTFLQALGQLYKDGNLSRTDYADALGYDWNDQMDLKEEENKVLEEKKLEQFAPAQFSPAPGTPGQPNKPKTDQNPAQTG